MSSTKLLRWSGLSLVLGGITLAVHYITHPSGETWQYALYPLWKPSHWLGGIAYLLIPLGLIGLYARQSEKVGWLGLIGFILTFVGFAISAGANILLSVAVLPFLAARGLDWLDAPNGELFTSSGFQLTVGLIALGLPGLLLLAVATLRARVLPRWGTWLVILTIPLGIVAAVLVLFVGMSPSFTHIASTLIGGVLSLGLVAWGWALWSETGETVAQAKTTM
jgi:hypothetical protein